MALKIK
jgi:hypothetical protein